MQKKAISILTCVCMAMTVMLPFAANVGASNGNMAQALNVPKTANGLTLSKTATPNGDGKYKISMEAYTTGKVNAIPTDIVLVLDQSGSMDDNDFLSKTEYNRCSGNEYNENEEMYNVGDKLYVLDNGVYYKVDISRDYNVWKLRYEFTYSYTDNTGEYKSETKNYNGGNPPSWDFHTISYTYITRRQALKEAVKNFYDSVSKDAINNNVNHRIAMVGFATDFRTEMLTGPGAGVQMDYLTKSHYANALQDLTTQAGQNNVLNAIDSIGAKGSTRTDLGMEMAENIFKNDALGSSTQRQRVVVVISDGSPQRVVDLDFNTNLADSAIKTARKIKNNYLSKVFSISIFPGADINATNRENLFMNYLSSNYPDALKMSNSGDKTSNEYYLTANDRTGLDGLFQKISQTVTKQDILLNAQTQVKDSVSEYFSLSEGATTSQVKVYTQAYKGNNAWGSKAELVSGINKSITGNQVSVSGFDFDANCVTQSVKQDGTFGKKLIIEFDVQKNAELFGGNAVPTNNAESGVYSNNQLIANFETAKADVPIKYSFDTQNQKIYLSDKASVKDLLKEVSGYSPNGINNAFVDIKYTIKNGTQTAGTYTVAAGADKGAWDFGTSTALVALTDTQNYTVECKVTPSETGSVKPYSDLKSAKVYVYKPTVTLQNSMANYNDNVDLNSNVDATWNCVEITDNSVPMGNAPSLDYEFTNKNLSSVIASPTSFNVKEKTDVKITRVSANGIDLTSSTKFNPNTKEFSIGINTFDLIIEKNILDDKTIDQTFVVKVEDENGNVFNVTITPNDFTDKKATKKIKGLYCGMNYKVSEDKNWSWRYTSEQYSKDVNESVSGKTDTVTFENSRTNSKWLSGEGVSTSTFEQAKAWIARAFNNGLEG